MYYFKLKKYNLKFLNSSIYLLIFIIFYAQKILNLINFRKLSYFKCNRTPGLSNQKNRKKTLIWRVGIMLERGSK